MLSAVNETSAAPVLPNIVAGIPSGMTQASVGEKDSPFPPRHTQIWNGFDPFNRHDFWNGRPRPLRRQDNSLLIP